MASAERGGRVRCALLVLSALQPLTSTPSSAQLQVDPLEVMIVSPGASRAVSGFSVSNKSDRPVQATITRGEWDRAENGDNRFFPEGAAHHSCGAVLSVSPLSVRLDPHSSRVVRLAVQADSALAQECWDIVFVEEVPQSTAVKRNSLEFVFRTGVKIYVAPPGLRRDATVENMAVVESPWRAIVIQFHNTGAMHLVAKGWVEFRRLDNSVAKQVEIREFPTLPGAVRKVMVTTPSDLAPGNYIALALIDFGGAELVAGQIDYESK